MVVGFKPCAILLAMLAAAASVSLTVARPQGNTDSTQDRPVVKLENCAHPRLLAGVEAAASTLPDITTFIQAAKLTGLLNTVFAYHRYTLLVPTNEAFAALATQQLGLNSVEQLLVPKQKDFLTAVVRYHFGVGAARYAESLTEGVTQVPVFAPGAALEASTTDGKVVFKGDINHAAVVTADLPLCNSVMHIVDTVLVPASQEKLLHSGPQRPVSAQTAEL